MLDGLKEMLIDLKNYMDNGYMTVDDAQRLHAVGFALPAHDGKCILELEADNA